MGTKRTNDGQVKAAKKDMKEKKRASLNEEQASQNIDDVERENPDNAKEVVEENVEKDVEVEAISHAEQRKRRKLEKKKLAEAAVNGIDNDDVDQDSKKGQKHDTSAKKAEITSSDKETRSGFGIWVGNLAFRTDAAKLREFFASRMVAASITRVNMPQGPKDRSGHPQPNKGFAYVDFSTQDQVTDAVTLSEDHLDGRRLLIKDAKSYEGRPVSAARAAAENGAVPADLVSAETVVTAVKSSALAASPVVSLSKTAKRILDKQKNRPTPCLFVGNLGFDSTAELIQAAFVRGYSAQSQWAKKERRERKIKAGKTDTLAGSDSDASDSETEDRLHKAPGGDANDGVSMAAAAGIRKVRIGTFEDSGKCKGWAFVDFTTTAQATAALINQRNHYLNGRALVVEYATADAVKRGGGSLSQDQHRKLPKLGKAKYDPVARKEQKERIRAVKVSGFSSTNSIPIAANKVSLVNGDGKPHKPNKEERAAMRAEREALKAKGGRRDRYARSMPDRAPEAIVKSNDGQAVTGQKVVFE